MGDNSTIEPRIDETVRRRFEDAWRSGRPQSIENLLAENSIEQPIHTLEELVLIELEFAWKKTEPVGCDDRGEIWRPRIEQYLSRFPQLNEPNIVARLIEQEYRVRQQHGDAPDTAEFRDRFPTVVSDEVERRLTAIDIGRAGWPDIAGYEFLGLLGRGGMGVVYKARHIELDRLVAVKMLLTGEHADEAELERFRSEAQSVARLQHPNIVQVFDVGQHDGRSYFAQEYVGGGTLKQKLAGQPQPPAEAARLCSTLARAVHAAHQQAVIHRDLKPSNVLLGADGTPKIADFGLARRLQDDSGRTHTGQIVGTPSYMPPEQALGSTRQVSPANDIYALGAILYELVTGRPPFLGETAWDTVNQVIHDEPVSPTRLQPKLSADLETICLKCLSKDPANRYSAADEIAEELERVLAGRPIVARRVSAAARAWKWCRRNRTVASLAALVLVLLITGTVVSTTLAIKANRSAGLAMARLGEVRTQRNIAQNALDESELAHRRTQRVSDFIVEALRSPEPGRNGSEVTVVELLEEAVRRARSDLRDEPATLALLLDTIGRTYQGLGFPKVAIDLHQEAIDLHATLDSEDVGGQVAAQGSLGVALALAGRVPEAIPLLELTLEVADSDGELSPGLHLELISNLASAYLRVGRIDDAMRLDQRAYQFARERYGDDHERTARAIQSLGVMYQWIGDLGKSIELLERAVDQFRILRGERDLRTAEAMHFLAIAYLAAGRIGDAVSMHTDTLKIRREIYGPQHARTLNSLMYLGVALTSAGQFEDAIKIHQVALELRRSTLGDDHPDSLDSMNHLGVALESAGRVDEATEILESAAAARRRILGVEHRYTLNTIYNLASVYMKAERFSEAERQLDECIEHLIDVRTTELPAALSMRALARFRQDRLSDAEADCRRVIEFCARHMPGHWQASAAQSLLGECLAVRGESSSAEQLLREGLAGLQAQQAQMPANARQHLVMATERVTRLLERDARTSDDQAGGGKVPPNKPQ